MWIYDKWEISEILVFSGFTPLLIAANIGNEKVVETLIQKGANINATNDDGDSALNLAAKNSKNQLWNTKLCKKTSIEKFDRCYHSGHFKIMKDLVGNGTDINNKGAHGTTPLMIVAGQGKPN